MGHTRREFVRNTLASAMGLLCIETTAHATATQKIGFANLLSQLETCLLSLGSGPKKLASELQHAKNNGLFQPLADAATASGLPLEYILAIASRETSIQNILGDHGNAVGVMQVDARFHEIAREAIASGSWETDPVPLINYAVNLLVDNANWAEDAFPDAGGADGNGWLKIAASAYNVGQRRAKQGMDRGDSDLYARDQHYGEDILERMSSFAILLATKIPVAEQPQFDK